MRAALVVAALAMPLLAADAPPGLDGLPANRWVKVHEAKVGGRAWSAIVYCPEAGGMLYAGDPNAWNVKTKLHTLGLFRAQAAEWADYKPEAPEKLAAPQGVAFDGWNYDWGPLQYGLAPDRRKVPLHDPAWGNQVCYDSDRKLLVAFVRGETLEYDPLKRRWTIVEPANAPQAVYGSSLCYDPVNREAVLANGGFSVEGYPRTTWVYRAKDAAWAPLDLGGDKLEPMERRRQRWLRLRWLAWKLIEFSATGRLDRLDERARPPALTKLARELKLDILEKTLQVGNFEAVEEAYRSMIVPALDALEKEADALRVLPGPRMNARLVYDAKHQLIVCFGGDGQDRAWGDTWAYRCQDRRWERRHPPAHPRPGRAMTACYEPAAGLVLHVIHGQGGPETWAYDAGKDDWARLDIPGLDRASPAPHWMDYDAAAKCVVAIATSTHYGGSPLTTYALRLDAASAKRLPAAPSPEAEVLPIDGQFVLRDAASVGDLKKWKTEMDAWAASVPANTWVEAPAHGTGRPNWGRTWSSIVYDPDRRQLIYRDGGHGSYHGSATDHYDLATGRWFRNARREEPPWPHGSYFAWGRSFTAAPFCIHTYKYALFYNPLTKTLQRTDVKAPRRYDDPSKGLPVHDYDPDLGAWSEGFAYLPGGGSSFTAPLVPGVPDGLLCVNAWSRYNPLPTTAVWLQTAKGLTTWSETGPLPYPHDCHEVCTFFDPKRRRAMYYGGGNPRPGKDKEPKQPGLFALDVAQASPTWTQLAVRAAGSEGLPIPSREVVYVPKHDVFLMVEGIGGTGTRNEPPVIWALDPKANAFRRVEVRVSDAAKGRLVHAGVSSGLAHDPATDLCFYIAASPGPPPLWAFRYAPE